jgi:hypothetical protein
MPDQTLDTYQRKWIFNHQSLPVDEALKAQIKPLNSVNSMMIWNELISRHSPDSQRISSQEWPGRKNSWQQEAQWINQWESDASDLPLDIELFISWPESDTIYFCYEKYNVIETNWYVFKQCWKNFLFYDDGPILVNPKRQEVLMFHTNGKIRLGKRPQTESKKATPVD